MNHSVRNSEFSLVHWRAQNMMPVVILIGFEGTKYMLSESTITKLNRNCTCLPTSSLSPIWMQPFLQTVKRTALPSIPKG